MSREVRPGDSGMVLANLIPDFGGPIPDFRGPPLTGTRFLLPTPNFEEGEPGRPAANCLSQRARPRSRPLKRRVPEGGSPEDLNLATQTFKLASPAGRELPLPTGAT